MADLLERIRSALAGRYTVDRELGHGGMAVVFLAEDPRHHRPVALKVLRPELAQAVGNERFLREIAIAARLTHPNILPLHDSGSADGFLYYAMPYVEGESLRGRLDREHQLPLPEALRIIREVADAVGYAHSMGVIHRDIKPENILFSAGHAVVSDFGIARAVDAAGGERITETGLAIGTPAYMSPEQASGDPRIDGRSDIYALGCVLYEMLGGEPPFTGPSAQAVLARHAIDPVPPLRTLRPTTPAGVMHAVETALAKIPADRYATPREFTAAFDAAPAPPPVAPAPSPAPRRHVRLGGGVLALALLALTGWWLARKPFGHGGAGGLAVLYFDNRTGDSSKTYLADGITEEIIRRLGQVGRLTVSSGNAVKRFRANTDPIEVGRALGVANLVTGSVEGAGRSLRVRVELVTTRGGRHLWGSTYDRPDGDVMAIEDQIAQSVAGEVVGRLAPAESTALTARPTNDREAYDHYLKGNFYLARRTSEADGRHALDEYQAALRLDPGFAAAWGRMGLVYGIYANWPWPYPGLGKDSLLARGLAAANRAIALDSAGADGWLARGFLLIPTPAGVGIHGFSIDPLLLGGAGGATCPAGVPDCVAQSIVALQHTVQLEPDDAEAWYQYGRAEAVAGWFENPAHDDVADSALRHSLALEPDRAVTAWLLGTLYSQRRRWNDALQFIDSAMALGRHDMSIRALHMTAELGRGNAPAALADVTALDTLVGRRPASDTAAAVYAAAMRVLVTARMGDTAAARRLLDELSTRYRPAQSRNRLVVLSSAAALVGAGLSQRGIAMLQRLPIIGMRKTLDHPFWDPIQSDPRFRRLAEQVRRARDTPPPEDP